MEGPATGKTRIGATRAPRTRSGAGAGPASRAPDTPRSRARRAEASAGRSRSLADPPGRGRHIRRPGQDRGVRRQRSPDHRDLVALGIHALHVAQEARDAQPGHGALAIATLAPRSVAYITRGPRRPVLR